VNSALRSGYSRDILPSLCETRWLSRVEAVSSLLARYSDVYETLGGIHEAGGVGASDAESYRFSMSSFSWTMVAVITQNILVSTVAKFAV